MDLADIVYRRRFGDRKDGRLLRSLNPFDRFIPYIMVKKNDACNQYEDSVEISEAERWYRAKRREGYKGMGMLHLFIAAYLRTVAHCPGINRFIGGQKVFARNRIEIVMAVKRSMTTRGDETTIKVYFEPTDTIYDVYRKLGEKVDEIKANDGDNGTEQTAKILGMIPGLLLKFVVWVLNLMDYFGLIPQALLDVSPFHGSMIVTDLGSLGISPVYHHLYNFGNLPVFLAFGAKRTVMELDRSAAPVERKYVDFKVVMDERTVDGMYYAVAFKYMKYYLTHPAALELPPEEVRQDVP